MNEITNSKIVKKISREIIDYLMIHPDFPQQKITNLKGKFGKKYNYHKVIKNIKYRSTIQFWVDTKLSDGF